jgi:hypothetical protein
MQAASGMENPRSSPAMRYFTAILITLFLSVPAMSVELFRYRGAAKDGGTLEYIFETDEQDVPKTVSKEKAAEIAADFVTTFYHAQIGAKRKSSGRSRFHFGSFPSQTRPKDRCDRCFSSYCCLTGRL